MYVEDYMGMIKYKRSLLNKCHFEKECKEGNIKTAEQLLNLLFGSYQDDYYSEYVVQSKSWSRVNTTFFNRLNCLWVYPAFIPVALFRFLFFGRAQVDEHSKFGKILTYLLGSY